MTNEPETLRCEEDGPLWRITLDAPPGNVLDRAMVDALVATFERARTASETKAVLIVGAGEHFSFGASVEEHLPASFAAMLERMDALFRAIADSRVFVVAAVRGLCLGGGLELAAAAHRVIAARDAQFGCPEIRLGVFAPFAAVLLPERMGHGRCQDVLASGRRLPAAEARDAGLVDDVVENPENAARTWIREHLVPHSARSLRLQNAAAGMAARDRYERLVPRLLQLYREELMTTADAVEGLQAFLEKRRPVWRDA